MSAATMCNENKAKSRNVSTIIFHASIEYIIAREANLRRSIPNDYICLKHSSHIHAKWASHLTRARHPAFPQ